MKDLKLKVCGLRDGMNIRDTSGLNPDFLGFIFYKPSPRYVGTGDITERLRPVPGQIKKVGVFVDEPLDSLAGIMEANRLDVVQLHGNEGPDYSEQLKRKGLAVIKTFRVGPGFDFIDLLPFIGITDYFLFDTKGESYGGSGISFEWNILNDYPYEVPFFLGGGISLDNVEDIKRVRSEHMIAIDVNSCFESAPGLKDIGKLKALQEKLKLLKTQMS